MTTLKSIGTWGLTLLLVLFFLYVGWKKLAGNEVTAQHFQEWGYASWLLRFVGCLEMLGALLLLFPVTATSGAILLSLVMVGACYTLQPRDLENVDDYRYVSCPAALHRLSPLEPELDPRRF